MARERKTGRKDTVQKTMYLEAGKVEAIKSFAEREGLSESAAASVLLDRSIRISELKENAPMILVFANFKGGVAKTISCANLAYMLASRGRKVLLIDLDGQGDLSKYMGVYNPTPGAPCILDVMVSKDGAPRKSLDEVTVETDYENLYLVPSSLIFNDADGKMKNEAGAVGIDSRLRNAIEDMLDGGTTYDYILIDCPPSLDLVVTNAIIALEAGNAQSMLILPIKLEGFALSGANETIETMEGICRERRVRKGRYAVLRTIAEKRTSAYDVANDLVLKTFDKDHILATVIDKNTKVNESTLVMRPVVSYADENSKEFLQFDSLAQEIEDINYGRR